MPLTDHTHAANHLVSLLGGVLARAARPGLDLSQPTLATILLAVLVVLALVALIGGLAWMRAGGLVLRDRQRGSELSTVPTKPTLPLTCFRSDGSRADPLNIRVVAEAEQLSAAMVAAGWYRADEVTLVTSLRIAVDSILARQYSTAPVSDLYLFGRRQDYAFQFPGRDVRERDHVRFWQVEDSSEDGRPVWVGAATRDVAVKFGPGIKLPTHQISPTVDDERDFLAETLTATGWVLDVRLVPGFGEYTVSDNGHGDVYVTDGQVAMLVLADAPALLPFTDKVRGPTAGLARTLSRAVRWRLPSGGRARVAGAREALRRRIRARRQRQQAKGAGPETRVERDEAGSRWSSTGS